MPESLKSHMKLVNEDLVRILVDIRDKLHSIDASIENLAQRAAVIEAKVALIEKILPVIEKVEPVIQKLAGHREGDS